MKAITLIILALCADMQLSYASNLVQNLTGSGSDEAVCGVRGGGSSLFERIVGGSLALPHEFPWQASLINTRNHTLCGAIVIRRDWVVSACHCLQGYEPHKITVLAGEHHMKRNDGSEQRVVGQQIFIHPHYVSVTEENDIGLIKLAQPLRFDGKTVMSVCMPNPSYLTDGYPHTNCVVTGWGTTSEGGEPSNVLLKAEVPLISDQKCRDLYTKVKKKVTEQMLCAGYPEGGKDACQADSGGPLVCQKEGRVYFLAGVVSWGKGCGEPGLPGVYTEVAYYLDWLNSVMGK